MARPSKALISRRNAAEAALEVIDECGLEDLSLNLIAKKLGVRPPSLYHHFKDKSELLQEVARIMLIKIPAVDAAGKSFEEQIIARCVATRQTLLKHPHAAPLILRYFPRHMLLAAYDRAASEEPYPTPIQMTLLDALEKYTYGAALFQASACARGVAPMPPVDSKQYPSLAQAIEDNPFDEDQLFVESLRLFLIGVRERIASNTIGQSLD